MKVLPTIALNEAIDPFVNRKALFGLLKTEIHKQLQQFNIPKYRANQVYEWFYLNREIDYNLMSNLPIELRRTLDAEFPFEKLSVVKRSESMDGTNKYLLSAHDGEKIEAVTIPEGLRFTACLSSQFGCAVGCKFCATAKLGFRRNLTSGEIIQQLFEIERSSGKKVSNIVFMGMGEPLLNRNELFRSIRVLTDPNGIGMSSRRITISTAGWLPGIEAMINQKLRVKLAISLNASTDTQRADLMPMTGKYSINELIKSAREYSKTSKTNVAISYLLLTNYNDTIDDAIRLSKIAKKIPAKINLMEYNDIGASYKRASENRVQAFLTTLLNNGNTVTLRTSRGADIEAACGQLAAKNSN